MIYKVFTFLAFCQLIAVVYGSDSERNNATEEADGKIEILRISNEIIAKVAERRLELLKPPDNSSLSKEEIFNEMMRMLGDLNKHQFVQQEREILNNTIEVFEKYTNATNNENFNETIKELNEISQALGFFDNLIKTIELQDKVQIPYTALMTQSPEQYSQRIRLLATNTFDFTFGQTHFYKILMFILRDHSKEILCKFKNSEQQIVLGIFNTICTLSATAYVMMQYSYFLLHLNNEGTFLNQSLALEHKFDKTNGNYENIFIYQILNLDRDIWRCDANEQIENVTYIQVTKFLQGFVENEADLHKNSSCRKNCGDYQSVKPKTKNCQEKTNCLRKDICEGQILNCTFFDSDLWICPSKMESHRRYEFIEYRNGIVIGNKEKLPVCETLKVLSWWRWLFWHCTYCFCICDDHESKHSDRYFNLRETVTNLSDNIVMTGLRFVKHNHVIHLQIKEGKLLADGYIEPHSNSWKPISNYNISHANVSVGHDYHKLMITNRSIDLENIIAPPKYVITGIRLTNVKKHLKLQARLTKYNFTSGTLIEDSTYWALAENRSETENRTKIQLQNSDCPLNSVGKNVPISNFVEQQQWLDFTYSDIHLDVAQNTVPFLDAQPVYTNPALPLSGVGLYYKGQPAVGGFIGPIIHTYDFTPHFPSSVQPSPLNDPGL